MMPWRKAAFRIVSSSSTWISMPTGSKRTVCVFPMAVGGSRPRCRLPGRGWLGGRRRSARRAAALVFGHVRLALLARHLVEQHGGAVERGPATLRDGAHLL